MRESLSSSVVTARGIRKNFGAVTALDGLDLDVRAGEVHGFLGPNGAGKSTTIRAILGQLRLTGGQLRVFGRDPMDTVAVHERLAYVPGDTALWPGLSGGECIDLIGQFNRHLDAGRRAELIERFELDPTRKARTYSKGNRQKVALIAALATDVEFYLLDEPTSGLDPLMENRFQETIREVKADGRTVLLSSHILDEVEALCDRVTIIRSGRTVSTGSLEDLRAHTLTTITVTTARPIQGLEAMAGVGAVVGEKCAAGVRTQLSTTPDALPDVLTRLAAERPTAVHVRPPSLDELFLEQYQQAS